MGTGVLLPSSLGLFIFAKTLAGFALWAGGGHLAAALWKQAKTLRVKRQEPVMTARGKYMPLRKARSS